MKFLDPRRDPPQSYFSCSLFLGISAHNGFLLFFHPNLHIKQRRSPEEFFFFHHSSGLGRRLPRYNTNQHIIIVREEISLNLPEQKDDTVEGNGDRALCSLETRRYQKRVWFWRSLVRGCYWIKRTGRRNDASVVGGHFQTLKSLHILLFILQVETKRSSYYKP